MASRAVAADTSPIRPDPTSPLRPPALTPETSDDKLDPAFGDALSGVVNVGTGSVQFGAAYIDKTALDAVDDVFNVGNTANLTHSSTGRTFGELNTIAQHSPTAGDALQNTGLQSGKAHDILTQAYRWSDGLRRGGSIASNTIGVLTGGFEGLFNSGGTTGYEQTLDFVGGGLRELDNLVAGGVGAAVGGLAGGLAGAGAVVGAPFSAAAGGFAGSIVASGWYDNSDLNQDFDDLVDNAINVVRNTPQK